jgi:succinylarginine dihydrolase
MTAEDEALAVHAFVEEERGRFTVVLDVVGSTGAVRHRIQTYPTRQKAELAARIVARAADRQGTPFTGGRPADP